MGNEGQFDGERGHSVDLDDVTLEMMRASGEYSQGM